MTKNGEMTSIMDSILTSCSTSKINEKDSTPIFPNLMCENVLNRKIQGLQVLTEMEWLSKYMKKNQLICKNILTNI